MPEVEQAIAAFFDANDALNGAFILTGTFTMTQVVRLAAAWNEVLQAAEKAGVEVVTDAEGILVDGVRHYHALEVL